MEARRPERSGGEAFRHDVTAPNSVMSVPFIDKRFVLDPGLPRAGATGHVHRARDYERDGASVAVKLYDGAAATSRATASAS